MHCLYAIIDRAARCNRGDHYSGRIVWRSHSAKNRHAAIYGAIGDSAHFVNSTIISLKRELHYVKGCKCSGGGGGVLAQEIHYHVRT